MGTRMAPSYANIFMKSIEIQLIDTSPKKPKMWLRFTDVIFMIWGHGRYELENLIHLANNLHPTFKFSFKTNEQEIPFSQNCTKNPLTTNSTYISTLHSHVNRKSVPFGLLIRCKRICSEEKYFNEEFKIIIQQLTSRKYPMKLLQEGLDKLKKIGGLHLLRQSTKKESNKSRLITQHKFYMITQDCY